MRQSPHRPIFGEHYQLSGGGSKGPFRPFCIQVWVILLMPDSQQSCVEFPFFQLVGHRSSGIAGMETFSLLHMEMKFSYGTGGYVPFFFNLSLTYRSSPLHRKAQFPFVTLSHMTPKSTASTGLIPSGTNLSPVRLAKPSKSGTFPIVNTSLQSPWPCPLQLTS